MQKTNDSKTNIKYIQLEFHTNWINKIKSFFTYVKPRRIALYTYLDKNALINFLLNNYDISPTPLFIAQFKNNKQFIDAKGNVLSLDSEQQHYLNSKIVKLGNIRI